jgi:hypothetical protein
VAIYRKKVIEPYLKEVELYYQELRRVLDGDPPNPNVAEQYHAHPEQFKAEYTEIDFDRVLRCLARFDATVSQLKQLKGKKEKKVHSH